MDVKKLSDLIIKKEDLKDIPALIILRVVACVIEVINSGECFFDRKEQENVGGI